MADSLWQSVLFVGRWGGGQAQDSAWAFCFYLLTLKGAQNTGDPIQCM